MVIMNDVHVAPQEEKTFCCSFNRNSSFQRDHIFHSYVSSEYFTHRYNNTLQKYTNADLQKNICLIMYQNILCFPLPHPYLA